MKIRRHYIALRHAYPDAGDGMPVETTLAELAETLDCTHRNMVHLLGRMTREGWLDWTPKRGRGNRSLLAFKAPLGDMQLEEAKELALRGDLRAALSSLQQLPGGVTDTFQEWLAGQFGFRSEVTDRRRRDMLRFPLPGAIETLDPARIHYFGESHLVNQLFDSLLRMDARGETVLPHLAHAWETDESRTVWTFYLRKGIMFHHGREMTAFDVRYSLQRLARLAPDGLYSWVYNGIASMEAADDTTLRIVLRERNEAFLSFLTTNRASIVPHDICEAEGVRFGRPGAGGSAVGTGPFRLAACENGIWSLDAFGAYFQGRAFLDRVEVWTMPLTTQAGAAGEQAGAAAADAANDALSATGGLPAKAALTQARQYLVMHNVRMSDEVAGEWRQVRQSGTTCKFITVNELKAGPLAHPEARAQLDRAIDRSELLRLLSGDVIEEATSFWTEGRIGDGLAGQSLPAAARESRMPLTAADNGAGRPAYRAADQAPDAAAAGPAGPSMPAACDAPGDEADDTPDPSAPALDGIDLTLVTIPQYAADAELIRRLLAASGIRLQIKQLSAAEFKGAARMSADLLLFAVMLDEHRELRLVDLYQSMAQHLQPASRAWTELELRQLLAEPDRERRKERFVQLERRLASRSSLLFLYRKHLKTAFHPSVRGISLESLGWVRFRDLWFR